MSLISNTFSFDDIITIKSIMYRFQEELYMIHRESSMSIYLRIIDLYSCVDNDNDIQINPNRNDSLN